MSKRYVSIWLKYLSTDWFSRRQPALKQVPFVLTIKDHGRLLVSAANPQAEQQGIYLGMPVADARIAAQGLEILDDRPELPTKILKHLAEFCIRFTPVVAIDPTGGLIFDATGCPHLWGGERSYLKNISARLDALGFISRIAISDTIGTAWACARFGKEDNCVVEPRHHLSALLPLPPTALRLEPEIEQRLYKLGLRKISDFIGMPRPALRRRFGSALIKRLNQALGHEQELVQSIHPYVPYQERLACLEPIATRTGIEIALEQLLQMLCERLSKESKGLRKVIFKSYRVDDKINTIEIGTNRATHNKAHLLKLFSNKLDNIEPGEGIEVFTIEALQTEVVLAAQEKIWNQSADPAIYELLDRIEGKFGNSKIHRFLPAEHHWPERSIKAATSIEEKPTISWRTDKPRPIHLLSIPDAITVTAPIPDYPPMLFRYKGTLHKVMKADGPERIEQEWWIRQGEHRDYYVVEDETGCRFWIFRLGHYTGDKTNQWFLHGIFA